LVQPRLVEDLLQCEIVRCQRGLAFHAVGLGESR
jgi:hypothetical protein